MHSVLDFSDISHAVNKESMEPMTRGNPDAGKSCGVTRNFQGLEVRTIESMRRCLQLLLLSFLVSAGLHADTPAFDLAGPKVDVHVKRGEITLPISEATSLLPGDRLWVHTDLQESQSAHYVLIVAFLL